MARALALCALVGVFGIVSAGYSNSGSTGNHGMNGMNGMNGHTGMNSNTAMNGNTGTNSNTGMNSNTGTNSNTAMNGNTGTNSNTGMNSNTGTNSMNGNNGYNSMNGNTGMNGMNCPAKKYMVEGIVSDPYLATADANGKNSGFIIDLLELFKSASGGWFNYQLTQSSGAGSAGYAGLVTDLQNKKFDIVAADFTVTAARQAVIDFLQPYLRTQIRILVNNNGGAGATNGVVQPGTTYYVQDDVSVTSLLQTSSNATLNAIYKDALANNRIVDQATGVAAVDAANSPTALIGTSPGIVAANGQSAADALTPDILETAFFAFGIQSNQNALRLCLNILQLKVQETGQIQALRNQYGLN